MNWSRFFSIGGNGFYVWGSYLFAVLAIGGEVAGLMKRKKALSEQRNPTSDFAKGRKNEKTS